MQVTTVKLRPDVGAQHSSPHAFGFKVIRDDLLHAVAGSKLRKFDARFPQLVAPLASESEGRPTAQLSGVRA